MSTSNGTQVVSVGLHGLQAQQAGSSAAQALPWLVVVGSVLLQVHYMLSMFTYVRKSTLKCNDTTRAAQFTSVGVPALQALLWWLPAAWALRFFGHDSSAAHSKHSDGGTATAGSMRWSDYTVMLQWDPRSIVTPDELAEWATQYGEVSSARTTLAQVKHPCISDSRLDTVFCRLQVAAALNIPDAGETLHTAQQLQQLRCAVLNLSFACRARSI
jgi:hypothetical protein